MAGGYKVGDDCKFYYCEAGIGGTPTWVELPITQEPTLDLATDEAEVPDRASTWKRYKSGKQDAPISLRISRKVGDAGYIVFRDAFLNKTVVGIAMASGDITTVGEEVFMADVIVTAFPVGEPLSEVGSIDVSLRLAADSVNAPSFEDVTL